MTTTTRLTTPPVLHPTTTLHLRAPEASMSTAPKPDGAAAVDTPLDTLDCKACGRTMAIISPEGDRQPQGELDEGCGLCKHFFFYFQEYEKAKELFEELETRRDNFQPRVDRLGWMHTMQMLLGNYIQTVTVWDNPDEEEAGIDFGDEIEQLRLEREDFPESDNSSAGLPEGPSAEAAQEQTEGPEGQTGDPKQSPARDDTVDPPPQSRKRSLSLQLQSSPGPRMLAKRPRLSHDRNRRISFDSSVVFRDVESEARRADEEFSRSSDIYSPGRWAAPEGSEWLDTSGHGTTIAKFTGVNKRGSKWVPNKEGLEMDEEWESARVEEADGDAADQGMGSEEGRAEDLESPVKQVPESPVEEASQMDETEKSKDVGQSVGENVSPGDFKVPRPDASV